MFTIGCVGPRLASHPPASQRACKTNSFRPWRASSQSWRPLCPEAQGSAVYWSLGLATYWYETVGWGCPDSSLNSGTASYEADGSVRAVIAHRDPGSANWIDPKRHEQGTLVFRWSRSASPVPPIETELVALDSL